MHFWCTRELGIMICYLLTGRDAFTGCSWLSQAPAPQKWWPYPPSSPTISTGLALSLSLSLSVCVGFHVPVLRAALKSSGHPMMHLTHVDTQKTCSTNSRCMSPHHSDSPSEQSSFSLPPGSFSSKPCYRKPLNPEFMPAGHTSTPRPRARKCCACPSTSLSLSVSRA